MIIPAIIAVPLPSSPNLRNTIIRKPAGFGQQWKSNPSQILGRSQHPCKERNEEWKTNYSSREILQKYSGISTHNGGSSPSTGVAKRGVRPVSIIVISVGAVLGMVTLGALALSARIRYNEMDRKHSPTGDIEAGDSVNRLFTRPGIEDLLDEGGFERAMKTVASPSRVAFQ